MSKSYKKYPIIRQERADGRLANRFIRHNLDFELPKKGKAFKKAGLQMGINWAYYWSLEDAKKHYFESAYCQSKWTLKEYLIKYRKQCLFK